VVKIKTIFLYCIYIRVTNCPVFPGHVLFSYNNITIFYPYRGGKTYFKCIEINEISLSKLRVSFELAHVFAGPSVLVFGNQNMVTLIYIEQFIATIVAQYAVQS